MILNIGAMYELIDIIFWSAVIAVAMLLLVKPILSLVEKWSNGGRNV